MTKLLSRTIGKRPTPVLSHWCPGCRELHDFAVEAPLRSGEQWKFDGDFESPTFDPERNIVSRAPHSFINTPQRVCRYTLEDGILRFSEECTHELAGQSVPLPDIPESSE